MNFKNKLKLISGLILSLNLVSFVQAAEVASSLPPMEQSPAYRKFLAGPQSEGCKIMYLIERFKESDAVIQYGSHRYKPSQVVNIVRAFFAMKYDHKQSAEEWIVKYANRTIPNGKPILIEFPDGRTTETGKVLLGELARLEKKAG